MNFESSATYTDNVMFTFFVNFNMEAQLMFKSQEIYTKYLVQFHNKTDIWLCKKLIQY